MHANLCCKRIAMGGEFNEQFHLFMYDFGNSLYACRDANDT